MGIVQKPKDQTPEFVYSTIDIGSDNPLQYSCPGKSHGQRSGAGYRLWGPKRVERNLATKQQMRTYCIAQGARPKCSEVA